MTRLPERMLALGREKMPADRAAELARARREAVGQEAVLDLTGAECAAAPPAALREAVDDLNRGDSMSLHGYTTAAGLPALRSGIAAQLTARYGVAADPERMYVTFGATAALAITLRALLRAGDEVLAFAPCPAEYRLFTEAAGGVFRPLAPAYGDGAAPLRLPALREALSPRTAAVLIGLPRNPDGVLPAQADREALAALLRAHGAAAGRPVYLIADETDRELAYDGAGIPPVSAWYDDAVSCCSFSASLSIPGGRLGYLMIGPRAAAGDRLYAAVLGAGRAMGYVNPPSLTQQAVERCLDCRPDLARWQARRDILYEGLRSLGYACEKPAAGRVLFPAAPGGDGDAFCARAEARDLFLVPGAAFGCPDRFRAAFSPAPDKLRRALEAFAVLAGG